MPIWACHDSGGFAILSVLTISLILALALAGGFAGSAGAAAEAFDHARSVQALYLAESAAYRALAELRHRITVDFPRNIAPGSLRDLVTLCRENGPWAIIARYAGDGWLEERNTRRAVLVIAPSDNPLRVLAPDGKELGRVTTTIYVRAAENPISPRGRTGAVCVAPNGAAAFLLRFDAFIIAGAAVGRVRRSVCLKTTGNVASCGAWMRSADPGDERWDSRQGWKVMIEAPSPDGPLAAPRWPRFSDVLYDKPLWEEVAGG